MNKHNLKFNSIINFIKTVLGIIFPLITFPYASRILGTEGIGKVEYANSVANYFVLFAGLGISTYAIREGAKVRDDKEKLNQLCGEIILINMISTAVAYVGLIVFTNLPVFKNYRVLLLIFGTTMILNLVGVSWVFNIFEDYMYITVRTFVFQLLSLILLFVFVRTEQDYIIYAILVVLATAGSNICSLWYARKYITPFGKRRYCIKKHLRAICIIFGMGVASQIYLNMDTTMIGLIKGDNEVGLYSAAVKINRTLGTLISSVCAVLIPRLSYYIKKNMLKEYKKIIYTAINYIMCMTIPCAFGFVLLSPEIIILFSGENFLAAVPIMRVLAPNIIFSVINGFLAYQVFIPFDKEQGTLFATIVGAIANVILNYLMIFPYGALGAAVATVIAEMIVYFILRYKMRKFYQDKTLYSEIWKYLVAGLVMYIVGALIGTIRAAVILRIAVTVTVCGMVYFLMLFILRAELVKEVLALIIRKNMEK